MTKKNERMLFVRFADLTGTIEVVVFPKTLEEYKDFFTQDACIALFGKISKRNGDISIIAEKAKAL